MSYAERRNGKLTGRWFGEAKFFDRGRETRFRRAFDSKKEADGYEAYVHATKEEPPYLQDAPTEAFAVVAKRFKERNLKWFAANGNAAAAHTNAQRFDHAVKELGAYDIKAVTLAVLEKFVDKLVKRGNANRTVNKYLDAVSKVLQYAYEHRMLPAGMPKVPRLLNEGDERVVTSVAAENAICADLEKRGKEDCAFIVRVLAATGVRTGELWKLYPAQIENEGFTLEKNQTKTKDARWVYLHPDACRRLRTMIANGKLPDQAHLARSFKDSVNNVGENPRMSLYSLRHARVTRLVASGADALEVAKIVGHRSLQTTLGYYKPDKAALAEVAKKVPDAFGELEQKGVVVPFEQSKKSV